MGDALNIQNLLDKGYFTTSRARNTAHSTSPRPLLVSDSAPTDSTPPPVPAHGHVPKTVYLAPAPPLREKQPPAVTVEDEVESLGREYGLSTPATMSEDEPPSRGEVDQYPIIMEVHEHNPERRFIIIPENVKDHTPTVKTTYKIKREIGEHPPKKRSLCMKNSRLDDTQDDVSANNSHRGLKRCNSKQHLRPKGTEMDGHHTPMHCWARSAANGPQTDNFDNRHPRPPGDNLLPPQIASNGPAGCEEPYCDMPQSSVAYSAASPSRTSHQFETRDLGTDRQTYGQDRMCSARRSTADPDIDLPRRRMMNDTELRTRNEYLLSRSDKAVHPRPHARPEGPRPKLSPRPLRDPSYSTDEYSKNTCDSGYLSSRPIVVQDSKTSPRQERRDESSGHARSASRTSTVPLTAAAPPAAANAMSYEASKTAPMEAGKPGSLPIEQPVRAAKVQLPYPDDDLPLDVSSDICGIKSEGRPPKTAEFSGLSMPEPGLISQPWCSRNVVDGPLFTPSTVNTTQTWVPAPFDPEKDGLPTERPIGAYRSYSENTNRIGAETLPECPRQKPIAGLMDWLTIPHTHFNICPSCYSSIFAKSDYRTLFKPMLRPSDEPISCDFGVCPWYRIAWLLTLKDDVHDLRLLQQIANVSTSTREPCPGSKRVTRNWLSVKDPHTRLPVDNFSVCYQCARIVELLLPNLTGIFEPLDVRPLADVCALHFTPDRKEFVLFFDALETTSDKAMIAKSPPDVDDLAQKLWHLTVGVKCREDTPIEDGYWQTMQFLPEFTVCSSCFEDVVKPKLSDGNIIARNFYMKPQRLPSATCQLYSARMREIFRRACHDNDPKYLEEKVIQRRRKENDIYYQLVQLDRANVDGTWKEKQVGKLVDEWKRWE